MKKLILTLLSLILALSLCACGDDPAPESSDKPENEQTTAPAEALPEISLNDYVVIEEQGCEGSGSISIRLDYERLVGDNADKLKADEAAAQFGYSTSKEAALSIFQRTYDVIFESSDKLSNGDTVDVRWNTDDFGIEDLAQVIEATFTYENFTHTVSQLEPLREVDPFQLLTVTFTGYDTLGRLDYTEAETDDSFLANVYFEFSAYSDLSNGDIITCRAACEKEMDLYKDYVMTRDEMTFTVSGLTPLTEIDPFEQLEISYTGVDGSGQLSYTAKETEDPYISSLIFSFDKTNYLTAGDTVTCTVKSWETAEEYGYRLTTTSKTITVPTLNTYVTDFSQLDPDTRAMLLEYAAQQTAAAYPAEFAPPRYLFTGTSIFDYALLSAFDTVENIQMTELYSGYTVSFGYQSNLLGCIFSMDLTDNNSGLTLSDCYSYAVYTNLELTPNGTLVESWQSALYVHQDVCNSYDLMIEKYYGSIYELTFTQP